MSFEPTHRQINAARFLLLVIGAFFGLVTGILYKNGFASIEVIAIGAVVASLLLCAGLFAANKVAWWFARIALGG